jgi:Winged helix-turn helix
MQSYHRVHVRLRKKERKQIAVMLNKGWESARVLRRAAILRQLDQGQRAAQVADNVGVAPKTVRALARRYEEEGLESALYEKPRPGQRRVLDAGQSQRIIALVCSPPPPGTGAMERTADRPGSGKTQTGSGGGPGNDPHSVAES